MPRLKIAHVITGLRQGGAETVLLRLVTHLTDFEHHVISLTDAGDLGPAFVEAGIPVIPLQLSALWPSIHQLVWHLYRLKPDVVQTWMYHGDLLGCLAARTLGHKNIIWNIRNSTLDPQNKWTTRATVKLCARLSNFIPRKIITCSQQAQKVHEDLGYASDKFRVIPNGIDCKAFRPHAPWRHRIRASLNLASDTPVIGTVARFDPQKDFPTFIKAAQQIASHNPKVRFMLIGPGCHQDNPELSQWIQQANLAESFILTGPRQDIPELLNALDLFVLSSAYGEAFPNVIAEAMACGIPCVATTIGDTTEIIGDTGLVVPPGDPAALAAACLQVLAAPPSGQRQRIIDLFSLDLMIERYRQLYQSLT
jgi:glycosyltransferase involved in cell wall biosynthesis